MARRRQA